MVLDPRNESQKKTPLEFLFPQELNVSSLCGPSSPQVHPLRRSSRGTWPPVGVAVHGVGRLSFTSRLTSEEEKEWRWPPT